ncbi:MAG: M48 family metallopeptidase [Candidatus Omnitrophota bacterium]
MPEEDKQSVLERAKEYSHIKYTLAIVDTICLLILLFLFQALGLSKFLASYISSLIQYKFLLIPIYLLIVSLGYYLISFPLNFYHSFILEHKFCLSNQKWTDWFKDQVKSGIIFYIIFLILFEAFYLILKTYPQIWWLIISLFWIFFSLILAKLAPIIIIPLFFKYKKLPDDELRQRIISLADKIKVKILDVFEIDFSKKTLKANAAFVGWGSSRRVLLADTLKDKYSIDEIEVILAHEFAHYKLKHLVKLILVNSFVTVVSFYVIFITSGRVLYFFGLSSLEDISAFPVVLLYLAVFAIFMQPFQNYISCLFEKNADRLALKITGKKDAFISMMDKLSVQNLADKSPHPVIKFLFFDHPPVDERIKMAQDENL